MFFGVRTLIAHCSRAFTLEPGDLIATGTPAGVGVYGKPPRLLRDGDEMIIRIEGIGDLRNRCRTTGEPKAAEPTSA
jgi:2-keto-4-pentenoate hydratase/2-oxohepta-3-ene-1,7-dioic acid hydratase in catechol pathway